MAKLSVLLERIHDEFPSVPEDWALRALSDSTKEFCSRTHAWQEVMSRVMVKPGVKRYTMSPDTGVQVVALKEVRLDGARLTPIATERLRLRQEVPSAAVPRSFTQVQPDTIELSTAPLEAGQLNAIAALTLALGATTAVIPDTVIDEYGEAIAAGAKMRLVRQVGQVWSSPDAALLYAPVYYGAINTAKARAMTALGQAEVRVEINPW